MKKLYYPTLLLFTFGFIFMLNSQAQKYSGKTKRSFTHEMTPEEKSQFHLVGKDYLATDPPPGEIRNIAEFDQMEGVLIAYPIGTGFGISYDVIAALSEETVVTTIVENNNDLNTVTNQYQSHGVTMSNTNFLVAPVDSYWSRDYGPWYIAYGDDQIGIVDFIYNRPNRPNDNAIPPHVADFLGIEWFGMDVIHTGGNYMTNGYGISSSTELVWDENPTLNHEQIAQQFSDYLGITNYMVVPDPNNTYIDHIDCWGKFLAPDKILIREVPVSHPQYDEIEATAAYYASQTSSYGDNYHVYRVWTPNNEPYTNSLILNNRVFVPITGGSWDDEALASYQEAMPGYEILGFTGSWESTDALHCRTKGIADRNTLYIKHLPLLGDQPVQTNYEVDAEITAYSGQPLISDQIKVIYWVNDGPHQEIVMSWESGKSYSAIIPGAPEGSEIDYYLLAEDESGKIATHPFIGEADPHVFYVGEQLFPSIALDLTEINATVSQGNTVSEPFTISNPGGLALDYSIDWSSAILEDYSFSISNSPSQSSWNSNTYTELGWTEFDINTVVGEISNWEINYHWQTDNYPEEGIFHVQSPDGTQAVIASGYTTGDYTINLDDFNGEQMQGIWRLWITDSYGDGGHMASDITVTITKTYQLFSWLTVNPVSGSVQPGESSTIQAICDGTELPVGDYEGTLYISSNDPVQDMIQLPVHFHVTIGTGVNSVNNSGIEISYYPNPFSNEMSIEIYFPETTDAMLEIYSMNGQKIKTLVNTPQSKGIHKFTWKGENENGTLVNHGTYFYRLKTRDFEKTEKILFTD